MCPAPNETADEVLVAPDGDAVFAVRQHSSAQPSVVLRNDPTSWHLWWTAPAAGSGALTVYVAAVDGNGGSGSPDNDQNPVGDDTVQASFSLREAGAPPPPGTHAGCSASGHPGSEGVLLVLLGLCCLWLRRSARPRITHRASR